MAIVCTSDGSIRSLRALPHAARLARITGEDLLLLRVLDEKSPGAAECEAELKDALDAANADGAVVVAPRLSGESIAGAITRLSREAGAKLLACDTRGSGALRHALIGSVAVEVLEESVAPVLMTGPEILDPLSEPSAYRVAFASDGGQESAGRFAGLTGLMGLLGVQATIVGISVPVLNEDPDALQQLERHCRDIASAISPGTAIDVVCDRAREFEKLESAIIRVATSTQAEAIAMATASTSRRRHVFLGSVSLATLNKSPLPVILVRADD